MRAFVAVHIDSRTLEKISAVIRQLQDQLSGIRWIRQSNIHLTLKFLGEVDEPRIEPLGRALEQAVGPFSRFTISAKGLGVFPGLKRPQVLWVGLEGSSLIPLASAVEAALKPFGFASERRSFKPHLSIGRWRQFRDSSGSLTRGLEPWKNYEFGKSAVNEVVLFESVLRPEGAVYRPLRTIALAS
jgi:2'-5' RNA ligase